MAARRITQLFLVATIIVGVSPVAAVAGESVVATKVDHPGDDDGVRLWTRSSGAALAVGSAAAMYFYARTNSIEDVSAWGLGSLSVANFVGTTLMVNGELMPRTWAVMMSGGVASLLISAGAMIAGSAGNSADLDRVRACYSVDDGAPCVRSLESTSNARKDLVAGEIMLASGVALTAWLTYSNWGGTRSNHQKTYVAPSAGGLVFGGAF
jgi:hypothetical protein